jgi:hypothetical protein
MGRDESDTVGDVCKRVLIKGAERRAQGLKNSVTTP